MPIIRKKTSPPAPLKFIEKGEATERLAINLFDLDLLEPTLCQGALANRVDCSKAFWVDKSNVEETAVAFTCPTLEAAVICDVLRSENRRVGETRPIRVYICRKEVWSRLPANSVLTIGGKRLNPEIFTSVAPILEYVPKQPKAVKFG